MRNPSSAPSRLHDLRLRGALLLPFCALLVHQLRYYLAFGAHAPARLAHDGHAYLATAEPFVLLGTALALGAFAGRLARVWQRGAHQTRPGRRIAPVWLLCALVLFTIYCGQELFEGSLALGHPAGLASVLAHGGWLAAPLSLLVGAALAGALKLAQTLIELVASRSRRRRATPPPALLPRARSASRDWRLHPQAGLVAGRAPPAPLSIA